MRPEDRFFAEFVRAKEPEALGRVFDAVAPEPLQISRALTSRATEAEGVHLSVQCTGYPRARLPVQHPGPGDVIDLGTIVLEAAAGR